VLGSFELKIEEYLIVALTAADGVEALLGEEQQLSSSFSSVLVCAMVALHMVLCLKFC
jgi:hypothetical protein